MEVEVARYPTLLISHSLSFTKLCINHKLCDSGFQAVTAKLILTVVLIIILMRPLQSLQKIKSTKIADASRQVVIFFYIFMRLKTGPLCFCFFQNLLKPIADIE